MERQIEGLAGAFLLALGSSSCIAPQQGAQCPCSNAASSTSAADAPGATGTTAATAPPAVKPKGALIADGTSATLLNIDPPGTWFVLNDKTAKGTMIPPSTGEFASALVNGAVHSSGKGFSDWGGGIGFNFVGADSLTPLDASAYGGISFKASGSAPMHIGLATVATMPEFGVCTKCYDHFAADITPTATPKVYSFKWSQLHQGGSGAPRASLDPHTLIGVNFTSKGTAAWDFTLDDISFIQ